MNIYTIKRLKYLKKIKVFFERYKENNNVI